MNIHVCCDSSLEMSQEVSDSNDFSQHVFIKKYGKFLSGALIKRKFQGSFLLF